jgi:hypothetical protein
MSKEKPNFVSEGEFYAPDKHKRRENIVYKKCRKFGILNTNDYITTFFFEEEEHSPVPR